VEGQIGQGGQVLRWATPLGGEPLGVATLYPDGFGQPSAQDQPWYPGTGTHVYQSTNAWDALMAAIVQRRVA